MAISSAIATSDRSALQTLADARAGNEHRFDGRHFLDRYGVDLDGLLPK